MCPAGEDLERPEKSAEPQGHMQLKPLSALFWKEQKKSGFQTLSFLRPSVPPLAFNSTRSELSKVMVAYAIVLILRRHTCLLSLPRAPKPSIAEDGERCSVKERISGANVDGLSVVAEVLEAYAKKVDDTIHVNRWHVRLSVLSNVRSVIGDLRASVVPKRRAK